VQLTGYEHAAYERMRTHRPPNQVKNIGEIHEIAQQSISPEAFTQNFELGKTLTLDQALDLADVIAGG